MKHTSIINKEIVLIDWDWIDDKGPKCVEAVIADTIGEDTYTISLLKPISLPDGSSHNKLLITGRHLGHPVIRIVPSLIRRIFIFKHPLSRMVAPLVAVNVSTLEEKFFSIACVYLKSVYLKAIGKLDSYVLLS